MQFNKIKDRFCGIFFTRKILQLPPLLWIILFFIFPLILLFFIFAFTSTNASNELILELNLDNVFSLFSYSYLKSVCFTLLISLISATGAVVLGFYLAYFVTFLRNTLKYVIIMIIMLAFLLSPIIQFQSIYNLLSADGIINSFLLSSGITSSSFVLPDMLIVIICLIYRYLPVVYFFSTGIIKRTDLSVIETSLDLGASRLYIFWNIIAKNSKKNIFLSFVFILILCFGNVSTSIALDSSHSLFGVMIFKEFLIHNNYSLVATHLLPLSLLTILFSLYYNYYFDFNKSSLYVSSKKHFPKYKCISIGKELPTVLINSLLILFFLISIFFTILFSFNSSDSVSNFSGFSLKWYLDLFYRSDIIEAIRNNYLIVFFTALISTIFGSMLALSASRYRDLQSPLFFKLIRLPIMVSEILIGVALAYFMHFLGFTNYFTIATISLSTFCLFFSTTLIYTKVQAMDSNMESASLDLGADYIKTFFRATIPTMLPIIVSCFLLTFVFAFNEFVITYLTVGSNINVLSSKLLSLSNANSPLFNVTATLLTLFSVVIIVVGNLHNVYNKWSIRLKYLFVLILFGILVLFLTN